MRYAKFVAQVVATVVAGFVAASTDGVTNQETVNLVILGLGAFLVLGAANLPAGIWRYTKAIASAASAGAVVLASAITDGVSGAELGMIGLAAAGAVGVFAVRNHA